jgi:hypothetical protein
MHRANIQIRLLSFLLVLFVYLFYLLFVLFLRQGLAMFPWLAFKSQSSCLSLSSAGITDVHHPAWHLVLFLTFFPLATKAVVIPVIIPIQKDHL